MASFGEELKRERKLRDISLKEISEATKISIRFLEALEDNNFDVLPGGVFNRGFIRAYARFIGIDGEEMVKAYLLEISQREARRGQTGRRIASQGEAEASGEEAPAAPIPETGGSVYRPESWGQVRPERDDVDLPAARATRWPPPGVSQGVLSTLTGGNTWPIVWILVIVALVVGGGAVTVSLLGGTRRTADETDGHARSVKARLSRSSPPASVSSAASSGAASLVPSAAQPQGTAGGDQPGQPAGNPPSRSSVGAAPGPTAPAPGPTPPAPGPTPPAAQGVRSSARQLRVLATEATRVVVECAGELILDQELWPGQSRLIRCPEPVVLSAANAGAIQFTLDGGPASWLGTVGQQVEGLTVAPPPPPEKKNPDAGN